MKIDKNDPINKILFPEKRTKSGCLILFAVILIYIVRVNG